MHQIRRTKRMLLARLKKLGNSSMKKLNDPELLYQVGSFLEKNIFRFEEHGDCQNWVLKKRPLVPPGQYYLESLKGFKKLGYHELEPKALVAAMSCFRSSYASKSCFTYEEGVKISLKQRRE
jgi:hypothetical protein